MTNLERVTAKIFAENADQTDNIGQFGSAKAGNKNKTGDIATIQGLSAYTNGWQDAVLTDNFYPTLQEMNGVMKVMSYQTAYIMQKGIAEWDSGTTYYKNDICKDSEGVLYKSKVDNNINNDVNGADSTTWWESLFTGEMFNNKTISDLFYAITADFTASAISYAAGSIHTALTDGYIRWVCNENDTTRDLYINDLTVARVRAAGSHDGAGTAAFLPIAKGSTFKSSKSVIYFYPLNGLSN